VPEVLQSAPVGRRYLAGITGWNFAEHILNKRKRASLVQYLYSVQLVMWIVPQGHYYDRKMFDMKWHSAGG
jgi:hypothetical protein